MRVLSISLDPHVLDAQSAVAQRSVRYGRVLDTFSIIVPSPQAKTVTLSPNTVVYETGGSVKLLQLIRLMYRAFTILREKNYDVISVQDTYYIGVCAVLLARTFGCGLEIQVHGIEKQNVIRIWLSSFTLKRADSIRVVSRRLRERLHKEFAVEEEKTVLVPVYVETAALGFGTDDAQIKSEFEQYSASFKREYGERFNILSVNRLVPIKNIGMQLQAVQSLRTLFPNLLLHIVGNGPEKNILKEQVDALGIASHVVFHGPKYKTELGSFFAQSDCFVLTSDYEGYGMVAVEAAYARLPIIMTDVGCAGEMVVNEESALVVPVGDTTAFTTALRRMIEENGLRDRLKDKAYESVTKLPTFEVVLEKYVESWKMAFQNKD